MNRVNRSPPPPILDQFSREIDAKRCGKGLKRRKRGDTRENGDAEKGKERKEGDERPRRADKPVGVTLCNCILSVAYSLVRALEDITPGGSKSFPSGGHEVPPEIRGNCDDGQNISLTGAYTAPRNRRGPFFARRGHSSMHFRPSPDYPPGNLDSTATFNAPNRLAPFKCFPNGYDRGILL